MAGGEESESTKKSFFEGGAFKGTVALVGLIGAVWALLGAPKPWEVAKELAANPLPYRNTEIILDASARMKQPFGKTTTLAIASKAVARYAAAGENIGLALRQTGGSCGESSEPVVGFGTHHADDVTAAAEELKPHGKSNLSLAVRAAINDFAGEAFHRPGSENQLVIFAGGGEECGEQAGREIRAQIEQAQINPEIHLYAINVSKKEMKSLKAMKQQLKAVAPVQLDKADNVQQLYAEVQEDAQGSEGATAKAPASVQGGSSPAVVRAGAEGPPGEPGGHQASAAPVVGAYLGEEEPQEVPAEPTQEEEEKEKEALEAKEKAEKEAQEEKEAEEKNLGGGTEAPPEDGENGGEELEESESVQAP